MRCNRGVTCRCKHCGRSRHAVCYRATSFTREGLHVEHLPKEQWIVDEPSCVARVVGQMMEERKADMR